MPQDDFYLPSGIVSKGCQDGFPFVFDDGGRKQAGYRGFSRDCFVRAVAIAAELDYQHVYKLVNKYGQRERKTKRRRSRSTARNGVYSATARKICADLGFLWVPTMKIGSGCKVHLRPSELPRGRLIVRVSKHFCAVIEGRLHDTYDCSREGNRCVYGYWIIKESRGPEILGQWKDGI